MDAVRVAGKVAARQYRHTLSLVEPARELWIGHRRAKPQIKSRVRHLDVKRRLQDRQGCFELFAIETPIFHDMRLVLPRGSARRLHRRAHCAALVRAVKQEFLEHRSVSGYETRTHAGDVRALRKARENDQTRIAAATESLRGLQPTERWVRFIEVDFRVALVCRDHKTVPIRQLE